MLNMKMFVTKKGYVMLCNTCYDVCLKSSKHEEVSFSHEFISLGRRCLKHFSEVKGLKIRKKGWQYREKGCLYRNFFRGGCTKN